MPIDQNTSVTGIRSIRRPSSVLIIKINKNINCLGFIVH